MKRSVCIAVITLTSWVWLTRHAAASTDAREIDAQHSTLKVHVYKSGFLSAFAHNHEIQAPIEAGVVKVSDTSSVELRVDAHELRVLDPEASNDTRAQIQKTMLGTEVLDADHFPEIRFQSTGVEPKGPDHWLVRGKLTLHGKDQGIAIDVNLKDERYRGSATLKQTDFGITPVTVAGGTVKVKDEIKIEFDIALMK